MTTRCDTASLIPGKTVAGVRSLGVTGAVIRATTGAGDHGAGFLYNDWDGPEDDPKEFRGLIVSAPSAGTFFADEDGSFLLTGAPDGVYSFSYRLFVDGADLGLAPTATIAIGGINVSASLVGSTSTVSAGTLDASVSSDGQAVIAGAGTLVASGVLSASATTSGSAVLVGSVSLVAAGVLSADGVIGSYDGLAVISGSAVATNTGALVAYGFLPIPASPDRTARVEPSAITIVTV